jgi:hypothetical protein
VRSTCGCAAKNSPTFDDFSFVETTTEFESWSVVQASCQTLSQQLGTLYFEQLMPYQVVLLIFQSSLKQYTTIRFNTTPNFKFVTGVHSDLD